MLNVSDLSKIANVTADAVRHYVRIGLLEPKRHPDNGYRLFKGEDVEKVKFIRQAKYLGFTLSDIKKILYYRNDGQFFCSLVREIIKKRIVEKKSKIDELNALQKRMENALKNWSAMLDSGGGVICPLFEPEEATHHVNETGPGKAGLRKTMDYV